MKKTGFIVLVIAMGVVFAIYLFNQKQFQTQQLELQKKQVEIQEKEAKKPPVTQYNPSNPYNGHTTQSSQPVSPAPKTTFSVTPYVAPSIKPYSPLPSYSPVIVKTPEPTNCYTDSMNITHCY